MMVFKRKQIVVLALVLMIVIAGYLQYSYKKSSISAGDSDKGRLGEAVYVDSGDSVQGIEDKKEDKAPKDKAASKMAIDYFAQAKLEREAVRSEDREILKAITEDENADSEAKAQAYDQMMDIVAVSEKEMKIETLVKKAGFEDVIAMFGDDGSLDIVVRSPSLTSAQVAQIADIASRQAKIDIDKIHISNKY